MIEFLAFILAIVLYLFVWNGRRIWVDYHYGRGYRAGYVKGKAVGINEVWEDVVSGGMFVGHGRDRRYWVSVPLDWLENSAHGQNIDPPTPPKGVVVRRK
jgi:hypothetical protein